MKKRELSEFILEGLDEFIQVNWTQKDTYILSITKSLSEISKIESSTCEHTGAIKKKAKAEIILKGLDEYIQVNWNLQDLYIKGILKGFNDSEKEEEPEIWTYEEIKEKVFTRVEELAGGSTLKRVVNEKFNIDSINEFKCKYELSRVLNDTSDKLAIMYTVEIWGSRTGWLYSIDKLLECNEGHKYFKRIKEC